jgi:hypothetical protein
MPAKAVAHRKTSRAISNAIIPTTARRQDTPAKAAAHHGGIYKGPFPCSYSTRANPRRAERPETRALPAKAVARRETPHAITALDD